ncbi:Fold protein [Citrus sinensis]|nr:Fold protein [Citrus sinensis]
MGQPIPLPVLCLSLGPKTSAQHGPSVGLPCSHALLQCGPTASLKEHNTGCSNSTLSSGGIEIELNNYLLLAHFFLRMPARRAWQQRPSCLRPIRGCIHGDLHLLERVANVLTSLPFIALGLQTPRKNLNMTLYANSLVGVGVTSSLYHSSRGKLRKYLRWADYTMIATATVVVAWLSGFQATFFGWPLSSDYGECLSRALRDENPKMLMAASALALPIQPLMVSAVHTGMMEVAFAKRALNDPNLRVAHTVHKVSSLLGGVFFIADDVFPETPYLHAAWHLAAAVGVGTCNKLLE